MKFTKIISLMIVSIFIGCSGLLAGCSDENELGNLSVVTGLFLDYSEKEYTLIADCTDFSEQPENKRPMTKPILVTTSDFLKATALLNQQSESPLFFQRTKIILLQKELSHPLIKTILEQLFASRMVPADTMVLQADFSEEALFSQEYQSFGTAVENQLKKENISPDFKLYQLIKNPKNINYLPTVFLSENGFYFSK